MLFLGAVVAGMQGPRGFAAEAVLAGTRPLTIDQPLDEIMVDGIDRFALREIAASPSRRDAAWQRDFTSEAAYRSSVLVPMLISRDTELSGNPLVKVTKQPHREFIYRPAFEMGRHVIGYEVQKVLAAIDIFTAANQHEGTTAPLTVAGVGEGGLLAAGNLPHESTSHPPNGRGVEVTRESNQHPLALEGNYN